MNDRTAPCGSERSQLIDDLSARAAALPPGERESFLALQCLEDSDLRAEILRALESDARVQAGLSATSTAAGPPAPADPDRIGKYEIVRRFTESSGQAAAYLGFDPILRRHVVLKRYHDGDTPEGRRATIEEGRALVGIKSDYVAECLGIEFLDDEAFLVVEHIKGRSLAEIRREGPFDPERIAGILTQLAEGVAAVHQRGLIHRDIKPANVILGDDDRPRLVDFGLAAHLGSDRLRELSGTPSYMAPEQARGEPERIDFRTDVFGLGAVLYNLLTGSPPYAGSDLATVLVQARAGRVVPPRRLNARVPRGLERICLKAMAADPGQRYGSAAEFRRALKRWRRGLALPLVAAACVLALAAAVALVAFGPWRRTPGPGNHETPGRAAATPLPAPLRVEDFEVELHRRNTRQNLGRIGRDVPAGRFDDDVVVRATLSAPGYAFLIALNPDGKPQLCYPADPTIPPPRSVEVITFEDATRGFALTDGTGLQAFVLVISSRPLPPYAEWSQSLGDLPWKPARPAAVWRYDGVDFASDLRRGGPRPLADLPEPFAASCRALQAVPGVTGIRAVCFPVLPQEEPDPKD
jgi:tRNA A-37 threonylcarbamoyl transferase component Bud32